ncbi:bifunctional YncE family protein/alkaline phosphatase family protein [Bryocella elongata]|nr:phosphoesterase [Bryocella elongata]
MLRGLRTSGTVATLSLAGLLGVASCSMGQQTAVNLPSGKKVMVPAPGAPARVNSLPLSLAVSPDGRYVASINAGYGTFESDYRQSIAVMSAATGEVRDFPDSRLGVRAKETYFSGLVFSPDGTKLYASMASVTAAAGGDASAPGNGIVVYAFADGALKPQDFLPLPLIKLAEGRTSLERKGHPSEGVPYPAAIAVVPGTSQLLVAENLADSVALLDATTGKVVRNIDLSSGETVPSTYPIAVAVTKDGKRAFVALWNASAVAEVNLATGAVVRQLPLLKPANPTDPGTHPCALLLDEKTGTLYVALSNRDAVAAIDITKNQFAVKGYFDTRLPGQSYFGAEPNALAMSTDGSRLYAANMGTDAIAVLDPHKLRSMAKAKGMIEPLGFVPTEMMPTALAESGGKLFVATGRGKGTGPNNMPQRAVPGQLNGRDASFTYAPTLDYGSLAGISESTISTSLKASTDVVLDSNRMKAAKASIEFAGGKDRIKHVIYIIKENRTYDQVFGDLSKDGQRVANGDPSLTMYGASITPNQHKLVLQFGVLDNFFDSGEVSGEGHVWSNAAIGSDYMEKTWQINYRSSEHTYDYEGVVANGYPLLQHIPDLAEPSSGYLWTNFAKHKISLMHFGEYIASTFCTGPGDVMPSDFLPNPREGAMTGGVKPCDPAFVQPGQEFPAEWGGGKSQYAWPIPRLKANQATKPELEGHYSKVYPDFNLMVPDQIRINVFVNELKKWVASREAGKDEMPSFIEVRLGNDHTAGTRVGAPTPKASVADNDLAIGRAVDAISHSPYWEDTAFFILEDDAQNGADHVDAHRSLSVVVSKYAPHAPAGQPAFVDSSFYSTVSVIRTMETLLGAPPMNNNDAFAPLIGSLFTGPGDQAAFDADYSNRDNGLIYTANKKTAPGASASAKMDFSRADHADPMKLNLILWQDAKGSTPPPPMLLEKHKKVKDDDDN